MSSAEARTRSQSAETDPKPQPDDGANGYMAEVNGALIECNEITPSRPDNPKPPEGRADQYSKNMVREADSSIGRECGQTLTKGFDIATWNATG